MRSPWFPLLRLRFRGYAVGVPGGRFVGVVMMVVAFAGAVASTARAGDGYLGDNPPQNVIDIIAGITGQGTYTTGGGVTINKTGSVDSYASRLANLAEAGATSADGPALETENALFDADVALGTVPAAPVLGTILLGAGAFALGWKIGRTIDDVYARLGATDDLGQLDVIDRAINERWVYGAWSRCMAAVGGASCYQAQVEDTGGTWRDRFTGEAEGQPCPSAGAWDGAGYCGLTKAFQQMAPSGSNAVTYQWPSPSASCSDQSSYAGGCYSVYRLGVTLRAQAFQSVAAGAAPPDWYTSPSEPPVTQSLTSSYTIPSAAADATHLQTAEDSLGTSQAGSAWVNATVSGAPDPYGGGGGTPANVTVPNCTGLTSAQCTALLQENGEIGTITIETLEPGQANVDLPAGAVVTTNPAGGAVVPATTGITVEINPDAADMPIKLPQPLANETYDDYVARLQALGWVGTATVFDSDVDINTGPDGVVRLALAPAGKTDVQTIYRAVWPVASIALLKTTPITFWKNPTTAAPAPTPGPQPGEEPPVNPPGAPPLPPPPVGNIDFSPITNINFGCKFPFGFICYAQQVTGWFNVDPTAPIFDFNIGTNDSLGSLIGTHEFRVDMGDSRLGMNGYMAILRDLESVVLWIGAVYLIATKLLGFGAAGDPGEAIDEAL